MVRTSRSHQPKQDPVFVDASRDLILLRFVPVGRKPVISERDLKRVALLYGAGGSLEELAPAYGVTAHTLRVRLRLRYGGKLPARMPLGTNPDLLARAAEALEGFALALNSAELAAMAQEVARSAASSRKYEDHLVSMAREAE